MRPVEVLVKDANEKMIFDFRSIRAAYEFIDNGIVKSAQHFQVSRIRVNEMIHERDWFLVAAGSHRCKFFFVRYKTPKT